MCKVMYGFTINYEIMFWALENEILVVCLVYDKNALFIGMYKLRNKMNVGGT